MQNTYKFTVVGFGHIGKRHAKMIHDNPDCELVGIVDNDPIRKSELEQLGYNVPFYTSIDEFIANDKNKTEVVCVCTPNGLHAPLAIQALENKYHVVIEKPMALNKIECENVLFASLKNQKNVFVVKQNRYSPPSKWLKGIVDAGVLGKIFMVQINCYWNRDERYYKPGTWKGDKALDGGVLFTQFSHFIDIMYWIFGDIKNIQGKFSNFNHQHNTQFKDDSGFVSFDFVDGGMGCLNYSTSVWDTNLESSMTIIAEKGSIKVGGQYMNEIEVCHIKDYTMPELEETLPPNDYGHYKGSAANHHFTFQNVVDTLKGDSTISTNALEGLKVVEIIERIYQNID